MKIYLNDSVWDSALDRIRYLFDEFDNVIVGFSGGKDSTVTMNLALKVAEEKGRLPLKVCFVDQEAEWRNVIEYTRNVMSDPRVEPLWVQCPIQLLNATSMQDSWLMCWEEGKSEEWMRPKEDISIKENVFGTMRFKEIFTGIINHYFPDEPACYLSGVRCEESPTRFAGLTTGQTYKAITWGTVLNKKRQHFTFYPLYDWCVSDIWKAIDDNQWEYCKIYDELYRYGVAPHKMRVSNLHHETAVHTLFHLHEIEGDTWTALTKRLKGVNQAKHIQKEEMLSVKDLPWMFNDWKEYRDYLTDNLITVPEYKEKYVKKWASLDEEYGEMRYPEDLYRKQIASLLVNDIDFAKMSQFLNTPPMITFRAWKRGDLGDRARPKDAYKYCPVEVH